MFGHAKESEERRPFIRILEGGTKVSLLFIVVFYMFLLQLASGLEDIRAGRPSQKQCLHNTSLVGLKLKNVTRVLCKFT